MTSEQLPFEITLKIFRDVEIFRRVPPTVLEELVRGVSVSKYQPDERIINQGDMGHSMYVILSGHVKVHDKEFVVAEIEDGSFFGEFSLLDDEPRSLSITAINPTITGSIQRSEFYSIVTKYPEVMRDIVKVILKRLRTQNRKIVDQLKQRQSELEGLVNERTADLVKKNEELVITLDELKRTQVQLIQKEKNEQQFFASMSHEIRTPLNAINGMTRLLLMRDQPEDNLNYLQGIRQSCDNLIVIVNDILDLSKIEAGKMEFEKIPFNPIEAIRLVYLTLHLKAEEKGLTLKISHGDDVPEMVIGDPTRLNQILNNLTGNAIKFTEHGSVELKLENIIRDLTEANSNISYLHFSVSDSGIGMTPEQLGKVFERFTQASKEITRRFGGTGLGLTISKQLIELQGGSINVASEYGKGTTFSFFIPYEISSSEKAEEKITKPDKATLEKVSRLKVVMAEDNEFNQIVATGLLQEMAPGISIDCVGDGKQLLQKISEHLYDLILMDVQMPEMDGVEATEKIRASGNRIPIIVMTAGIMKEEIARCMAAGANDFVPKPFNPDELVMKMAKLAP